MRSAQDGDWIVAGPDTASKMSLDVVAKLSDAIEHLESMSSDEVLVILNEALTTITELVQMLDEPYLPRPQA
ncbi:hypothetical protein SAMN03159496_04092 [Rhizobium sp. NFR07]|nr:hypothetical protein SAMN03159496_04092 [Rhizobium sp. NFR07]